MMESMIDSKVMLKLMTWLENIGILLRRIVKRGRSWCFTQGVYWVFREKRPEREGEVDEFIDRAVHRKILTVKIPAVKHGALEELHTLTVAYAPVNSTYARKIADSLGNMTPKFLRYVNRRAEEGQHLYFDMYIEGYNVPRSIKILHSKGALRPGGTY